jgi:hypothetical protein
MDNLILQTRIVSVKFTPRQWSLYSDMDGAKAAARKLNATLKRAVNNSLTIEDARRAMYPVMQDLSEFGANDSEPMWLLEDVLNAAYGIE